MEKINVYQRDVGLTKDAFASALTIMGADMPNLYKDAIRCGYNFIEFGYYVNPDENYSYYHGDKKSPDHIEVSPQPNQYYHYDGSAWVLSRDKYVNEKLFPSIDAKTRDIIGRGATFGGNLFSLSDNAQRNWTGLNILNMQGLMTTMEVSTKDGQSVPLTDTQMQEFLGVIFMTVANALQSGRDEKKKIPAMTDVQLLAYTDPRS